MIELNSGVRKTKSRSWSTVKLFSLSAVGFFTLIALGFTTINSCKPRRSNLSNQETSPYSEPPDTQFAKVGMMFHVVDQMSLMIVDDSIVLTDAYNYSKRSPYLHVRALASYLIIKVIQERQTGSFANVTLYDQGDEGRDVPWLQLVEELITSLRVNPVEIEPVTVMLGSLPQICYNLESCRYVQTILTNIVKLRGAQNDRVTDLVLTQLSKIESDTSLIKEPLYGEMIRWQVQATRLNIEFWRNTNYAAIDHGGDNPTYFGNQKNIGPLQSKLQEAFKQFRSVFVDPSTHVGLSLAVKEKLRSNVLLKMKNGFLGEAKPQILKAAAESMGEIQKHSTESAALLKKSIVEMSDKDYEMFVDKEIMGVQNSLVHEIGMVQGKFLETLFLTYRIRATSIQPIGKGYEKYLDCIKDRVRAFRENAQQSPGIIPVDNSQEACPKIALSPSQAMGLVAPDKYSIGHEVTLPTAAKLYVGMVKYLHDETIQYSDALKNPANPFTAGEPEVSKTQATLHTTEIIREQVVRQLRSWLAVANVDPDRMIGNELQLAENFPDFHSLYKQLTTGMAVSQELQKREALIKSRLQEDTSSSSATVQSASTITDQDKAALYPIIAKHFNIDISEISETDIQNFLKIEQSKYSGPEVGWWRRAIADSASITLGNPESKERLELLKKKKGFFDEMSAMTVEGMAHRVEMACYEDRLGLRNNANVNIEAIQNNFFGKLVGCMDSFLSYGMMAYDAAANAVPDLSSWETPAYLMGPPLNLIAAGSHAAKSAKKVSQGTSSDDFYNTLNMTGMCGEVTSAVDTNGNFNIPLLCGKADTAAKIRKSVQCYLARHTQYQLCSQISQSIVSGVATQLALSYTAGPAMALARGPLESLFWMMGSKRLAAFVQKTTVTQALRMKGLISPEVNSLGGQIWRGFTTTSQRTLWASTAGSLKFSWAFASQVFMRAIWLGVPKVVFNGMAINTAMKLTGFAMGQPFFDPTKSWRENAIIFITESAQMGLYSVYTPAFDSMGQGLVGKIFANKRFVRNGIPLSQTKFGFTLAALTITPMEEAVFFPVDILIDGASRQLLRLETGNPDYLEDRPEIGKYIFDNLKGAFLFKRKMIRAETKRVLGNASAIYHANRWSIADQRIWMRQIRQNNQQTIGTAHDMRVTTDIKSNPGDYDPMVELRAYSPVRAEDFDDSLHQISEEELKNPTQATLDKLLQNVKIQYDPTTLGKEDVAEALSYEDMLMLHYTREKAVRAHEYLSKPGNLEKYKQATATGNYANLNPSQGGGGATPEINAQAQRFTGYLNSLGITLEEYKIAAYKPGGVAALSQHLPKVASKTNSEAYRALSNRSQADAMLRAYQESANNRNPTKIEQGNPSWFRNLVNYVQIPLYPR